MPRDYKSFVDDILETIQRIEQYTDDLDIEDFSESQLHQDAVIRNLEIIGEAVKNLPAEFKKEHPEVPWSEIARTRDKLIHGYFGVDLKLTFEIVEDDLPGLKKNITKILNQLG